MIAHASAQQLFEITFPVFSIVLLGYLIQRRSALDARTLAHLALMVTSPALVFSRLMQMPLSLSRVGLLIAGTVTIAAATALVAFIIGRWLAPGEPEARRALLLPAIFWNAGNMGLPIAQLAFGSEGEAAATIVFVVVVFLQSTVGVAIAKGAGGSIEALKQPLFLATALGLFIAASEVSVPRVIATPVTMLGDMAIPLMLLNLGVQLTQLRIRDGLRALSSVGIRFVVGIAAAYGFVTLVGVEGVERQVLIASGALPAAVINIVLAQKYDTAPSLVASAIVISTLASFITVPLILALIL